MIGLDFEEGGRVGGRIGDEDLEGIGCSILNIDAGVVVPGVLAGGEQEHDDHEKGQDSGSHFLDGLVWNVE